MKPFILFLGLLGALLSSTSARAQYKIVWEIASGDTADQRMLYKQVNNVLNAAPGTQIELVFHGPAIVAVLKDAGFFKQELLAVHKRGVLIAACGNSLKNRGYDPQRVMPEAFIVPAAIVELVKKQDEGWRYIKAGH
jgi:intracellular sulfur oxidation DsrE/DsrF family protein